MGEWEKDEHTARRASELCHRPGAWAPRRQRALPPTGSMGAAANADTAVVVAAAAAAATTTTTAVEDASEEQEGLLRSKTRKRSWSFPGIRTSRAAGLGVQG
jgi:hypothetical protein